MASQGFQKKISYGDALTWYCQHSACALLLLLPCVLGSVSEPPCSRTEQHVIVKMMMVIIESRQGSRRGGGVTALTRPQTHGTDSP